MNRRLLCLLFLAACTELRPEDDLCPPGLALDRSPTPQQLSNGENHPVALAVRGGSLYYANQGPPEQDAREGSIVELGICDRKKRILAREQARPTALVLDGDFVYWVNAGMTNRAGELWRAAVDPGGPAAVRLAAGESRPAALVADERFVYFVAQGDLDNSGVFTPGTGSVRRFDKTTGSVETLAQRLDAPRALAVAGGVVTFATAGRGALIDIDPGDGRQVLTRTFEKDSGAILRLSPQPGGAAVAIAEKQDGPIAVSIAGDRAYFLNSGLFRGTGALLRTDGPPIARGLDFPGAFVLDGDDIFVAITGAPDEHEEGHIVREQIGAQPLELAAAQQLPRAIAVDRHRVYWANYGELQLPNGTLWTAPR